MLNEAFVPRKWIDLTKSDVPNTLASGTGPICSAILCTTAGTAVMGFEDGSTITFTMSVGEQIAGRFYMFYTASSAVLQGALY